MSQVIPLGAPEAKRYFAPAAETTARQDGWVMVQIADAGIAKFVGKELNESVAFDLVIEVLRSGKWESLLAGLLVEQGVPWTPENAAANAEWFAGLTDAESKQALRETLVPTLAHFFLGALPSSMPSRNASPSTGNRRRRRTASATGGAPSTAPAEPALAGNGSTAPES